MTVQKTILETSAALLLVISPAMAKDNFTCEGKLGARFLILTGTPSAAIVRSMAIPRTAKTSSRHAELGNGVRLKHLGFGNTMFSTLNEFIC